MTPQRPRPWLMLALSTLGQSASSAAVNGPAFLIPALHADGLSLAASGWVAAASIAGATCTLWLWGAVVDAIGERFVLVTSRRRLKSVDAYPVALDVLAEPDAVTLLRRASGLKASAADDAALQTIARLCGHLPLARIERQTKRGGKAA